MEKIEFAIEGTFEQLTWFKEEAEKLGWKYMEDFYTEKEYDSNPYLYFCNETNWLHPSAKTVLNGFVLSGISNDVIVFDLNTQKEKALNTIKNSLKEIEKDKLEEFVDFIVDNYTVEDGELINDENRIESKEEVISTFKTMYGQCRI